MYGTHVQRNNDTGPSVRQFRSPTPPVERVDKFRPLGQQSGVQRVYGALGSGVNCFVPGTGHGQYLATQAGLSLSRGIAFQTGMGRQQAWQVPGIGRGGFGPLPVGGFGQAVRPGVGGRDGSYWGCSDQSGVGVRRGGVGEGRDGGVQEYRMVRQISPENVRREQSPPRRGRNPADRIRDRPSSRSAPESVFGDKGVLDPWGNWRKTRDGSREDYSEKKTCSRRRESRRRSADKKPRSGRRATHGRRDRSSSAESTSRRRESRTSQFGSERNNVNIDTRVMRDEKRLAEKRKYEQDRLEQVKKREERIIKDEKRLEEQQKLDYIKREERKVKQLEEERLKREKDLYLREEQLLRRKCKEVERRKLEERRNSPIRRERSPLPHSRRTSPSPKSGASNVSSQPSRSRGTDNRVTVSITSSPTSRQVRRKAMMAGQKRKSSASSSLSPERGFRRSPRPKLRSPRLRSPSVSTNQPVLDRIGTKLSIMARLGFKKKITVAKCSHCGGPRHGSGSSMERRLGCKAYMKTCDKCKKVNHVAKMCRTTNIIVESSDDEDSINNNNKKCEVFTTVDQVGYTEVPSKEIEVKQTKKAPVDLDKIVIKRRVKKDEKQA